MATRKKAQPQTVDGVPTTRRPRTRRYQGAEVSRLTADWVTGSTSADAEISTSMIRLRNRARQLCRDSDYARAALRAIRNNVVGTGIKLQMQVPMARGRGRLDTATNDRIESGWKRWGRKETCDVAGRLSFEDIERLAISSTGEAGEILIRMIPQAFGGGRTPLALEVIEADYLDETVDGPGRVPGQQVDGGEWRLGVHVNIWGRPVEYAFHTTHPGDVRGRRTAGQRVIVPADQILHLFIPERPRQTRGVTWFASAIKKLHQAEGYVEAEVVRARANSSLMGFITTDGEAAGETLGEEVDGDYVTQFEPGVFKTLFPGQDVKVPQLDAPDGQLEPFLRTILRSMAAGTGVAYESVSKDFSQTNYSSSRMSLLEERENWKAIQQWLIRELHKPVFAAWLRAAVGAGELSLPGYDTAPERFEDAAKWVPRGWEWVDPEKEGRAYRDAVRSGQMTRAEVVMSRGGDWNDTIQALANEKAQLDELGLVLDNDPAQVSAAGITQARPAGSVVPADASGQDPPTPPADATAGA